MYKVILIDDEEWILKALEALIDWGKYGFGIVDKAKSAYEAEIAIKKHSPDIVVSDIRMPGMNGLELLEKLNQKNKRLLTIFISAYGDFSYAQKALSLGAFEYLLKPVDEKMLAATLERAAERLNEMKAINKTIDNFRNANLFYELLESGGTHNRVIKKLVDNSFCPQGPFYRFIVAKGGCETQDADMDVISSTISTADASCSFLQAMIGNKKWVYLLTYSTQGKKSGMEISKDILKFARTQGLCFGVSKEFTNLEQIRAAYKQADMIEYNRLFGCRKIIFSYKEPDRRILDGLLRDIKHASSINQLKELIVSMPLLLKKGNAGPDSTTVIFNAAMNRLSEYNKTISESDYITENGIIDEYMKISQMAELLLQKVTETEGAPMPRSTNNVIIREILKEIETNYYEKLMISSLAEKYHINTSYLSDLFKKETGKPFTSYLVEFRMNKAMELLKEGSLTIFEISEKVGYDDYFHFNKLFKKYKNITPAAFRRKGEA